MGIVCGGRSPSLQDRNFVSPCVRLPQSPYGASSLKEGAFLGAFLPLRQRVVEGWGTACGGRSQGLQGRNFVPPCIRLPQSPYGASTLQHHGVVREPFVGTRLFPQYVGESNLQPSLSRTILISISSSGRPSTELGTENVTEFFLFSRISASAQS